MTKLELRRILKEEIRKVLKEENNDALYYNRAEEVVKSYENKNQLKDFYKNFPKNSKITKQQWFNWNEKYMDDMSELEYIKQHWKYITTGNDSVYDM